jgi:hypothetical protein
MRTARTVMCPAASRDMTTGGTGLCVWAATGGGTQATNDAETHQPALLDEDRKSAAGRT